MREESRARVREVAAGRSRGVLPGLRFAWRRRMLAPRYWVLAARYVWTFKVRNRHIVAPGFVFLHRGARVECRRGLGCMEIGRWVWVGRSATLRCHEGFLRVGDKAVFGEWATVDGFLDIEIGQDCMVADRAYVADYDHRFDDPSVPIRKQGIVKSRVRIEADCWIGHGASVLRGSTVGRGSVIGAGAVVKGDIPAYSVAVGVPARVLRRRRT